MADVASLDGLLAGLELDYFGGDAPASYETNSEVKALVLTLCYGRGISRANITIPRLPRNIPVNTVEPDIRELLPTRKRAGRGRARVLSQNMQHQLDSAINKPGVTMRELPRKLPLRPEKHTPPKPSYFNLHDTFVSDDDDDKDDDDDDEGYGGVPCMLLPSQRGIVSHPFGKPPTPKHCYDMKSSNDFPTLGNGDQDGDVNMMNVNPANRRPGFPGLPPTRSSKTVSYFDIVFKPMKDKKSKKKQKKGKCGSHEDVTDGNVDVFSSVVDDNDNDISQKIYMGSAQNDPPKYDLYPNYDNSAVVCSQDQPIVELSHHDTSVVELSTCRRLSSVGGSVWRLDGAGVIQIDGVPHQEDVSSLADVVSSFGTVLDCERQALPNKMGSMRFKYSSSDSCDWAVSCLHDSDCIFPDSEYVLQCYVIGEQDGAEYDVKLTFE